MASRFHVFGSSSFFFFFRRGSFRRIGFAFLVFVAFAVGFAPDKVGDPVELGLVYTSASFHPGNGSERTKIIWCFEAEWLVAHNGSTVSN
jgi:hypothetical protein